MGIDHENWSRYGIGPLWVIFNNTEWGRSPLVPEALKSWTPPRLFEQDGRALVPLTVLPNVTREIVLEDLLKQLKQLHDWLQPTAAAVSQKFCRMLRRSIYSFMPQRSCDPKTWSRCSRCRKPARFFLRRILASARI